MLDFGICCWLPGEGMVPVVVAAVVAAAAVAAAVTVVVSERPDDLVQQS